MNSNEIAVKNKTYCINVAQRLGEIVKKLNQNEQVDDGWEPIVQVDGIVIIPEGVTIIAEYAFMLCRICIHALQNMHSCFAEYAFMLCRICIHALHNVQSCFSQDS